MKKLFFLASLVLSTVTWSHALLINEIMSNPIGDDGGREWIELYNNSSSTVDIGSLTISIKGGAFLPVTSVSGGVSLSSGGYAVIASVVSGATKFSQDYPNYNGPLFKASLSLVNTGVTSLEIKQGGISLDLLSSYTAAKEGLTFSKINGTFVAGVPTPGGDNQMAPEDTNTQTSSTTNTQATLTQSSFPTADIVLYMQEEKVVVAGAETPFSVFALTRGGKTIDNLTYTWAYGDGGQSTGSSTSYRYVYPGKYIAQVEAGNSVVVGTGRTSVRVVAPEIAIKGVFTGKYGPVIDIENQNPYDLDFSQWRLVIDSKHYYFPKNTLLPGNSVTHLSGIAMGFASTTITESTVIAILFPNKEEVTRFSFDKSNEATSLSSQLRQPISFLKNIQDSFFTDTKEKKEDRESKEPENSLGKNTMESVGKNNEKESKIVNTKVQIKTTEQKNGFLLERNIEKNKNNQIIPKTKDSKSSLVNLDVNGTTSTTSSSSGEIEEREKQQNYSKKDTRLATFFRSLLWWR